MTVDIIPTRPEDRQKSARPKIKLYFVGWEMLKVARRDNKNFVPRVHIAGKAIAYPRLGDFILVDSLVARDVILKTRWGGEDTFIPESRGGAKIAAVLREAIENGVALEDLDPKELRAKAALSEIDDEALARMAEERGLILVSKDGELSEPEAPKKTTRAPRKSSSKPTDK
jgi:hypothetical protein